MQESAWPDPEVPYLGWPQTPPLFALFLLLTSGPLYLWFLCLEHSPSHLQLTPTHLYGLSLSTASWSGLPRPLGQVSVLLYYYVLIVLPFRTLISVCNYACICGFFDKCLTLLADYVLHSQLLLNVASLNP